MNNTVHCRFCSKVVTFEFIDLGTSPISNRFLRPDQQNEMEPHFPLRVYVCDSCFLVQLEMFQTPDNIFTEYVYFSSYSQTWLRHMERYADMAVERFGLHQASLVVEIASNDGYLLRYLMDKGIPVLGVEPARNVAEVAMAKGIPTHMDFFGVETARQLVARGVRPDLLIGNNVLAHVPNLNDFVAGMKILLKPGGTITMEFPHLLRMVEGKQFDTIYHEHFSYFSLLTAQRIFAHHGLRIFDIEELPTHGGSLRIYAAHIEEEERLPTSRMRALAALEHEQGWERMESYTTFREQVLQIKLDLLKFLIRAHEEGRSVVGYGAPAKGNTLLNFCGIRPDLLPFTVDISPHKQGMFLPGNRIPIHAPARIDTVRPDYLLILPWNIQDEIMEQMAHIREWGGRFVIPVPELRIL
ncbi:MAG: class I SAM-dependent methyltransferase [Magnetococcales bacterium]|nr:class I SAM-dependent methyltransferase [Magnetococcales bacterium]